MKPFALALGIALVLSSGCNSNVRVGNPTDGGVMGPVTNWDEFCAAFVDARCQTNLGCCTDSARVYPDLATCRAAELADCTASTHLSAVRDGSFQFHAAGANAAVAETRARATSCMPPTAGTGLPGVGTLSEGADCSGTRSDPTPAWACAPGLYCDISAWSGPAYTGSCRPQRTTDQMCSTSGQDLGIGPCESGQYCTDVAGGPGTCQARKALGESCMRGVECESHSCIGMSGPGVVEPGVCQPAEPWTTEGAFCFGTDGRPVCISVSRSFGTGTCNLQWTCPTAPLMVGYFEVDCTMSGSTYQCDCIQDSVVVGTFTGAASYCTAGEPQQIAGANMGCGWDVRL